MIISFNIDYKITSRDSTNSIYSGKHWTTRNKYANDIKPIVRSSMNKFGISKSSEEVKKIIKSNKPIFVGFLFPKDRIDIDNHSYFKKVVIDCLKGIIIPDDTAKYIAGTIDSFYDGSVIKVSIGNCDSFTGWMRYMDDMCHYSSKELW